MSEEWRQVGTVEVLRLRIYPIDPHGGDHALSTHVAVDPGLYPVYRKFDAFMWIMRGRINERHEKIGDGLFAMHNGDVPTGPEVQFPSRTYGPEQLADLIAEAVCQPGPQQRLIFSAGLLDEVSA